jgi:hypothetical protein
LAELSEPDRLVHISADDIDLFNPTSKTCPIFISRKDLEVTRHIYRQGVHIFTGTNARLGEIDFLGELFNLTRDSRHFKLRTLDEDHNVLPLYEAKYIHQFDHRFATTRNNRVVETESVGKSNPHFSAETLQVVDADEVRMRLNKRGIKTQWLCGFRDIASATNERTAIMAVFPVSAVGNSLNLVLGLNANDAACLTANVNSFAFDYCCRGKVSGTHVNIWIFKQLPAIPFDRYDMSCAWFHGSETIRDWLLPRVLEMAYTAWDLEPFAQDCGFKVNPFRWDDERRFEIRCEIDACFFHLYLPANSDGTWVESGHGAHPQITSFKRHFEKPRAAVSHILDQFPITSRKDEQAFGCYRTKVRVLEIYDAIVNARNSGRGYITSLNPPPGQASVSVCPTTGTPR